MEYQYAKCVLRYNINMMTAAMTLLITAIQLLSIVAGMPNIDPAFKATAIDIANQAITTAQTELAATERPLTTQQIQTFTNPNYGSITPMVETPIDKSGIVVVLTSKNDPDEKANMPYGAYNYSVSILDKDGNGTEKAAVTLTSQDNLYGNTVIQEARGKTTNEAKDWFTGFQYIPTSKGDKILTFTSGSHTKTINLSVE